MRRTRESTQPETIHHNKERRDGKLGNRLYPPVRTRRLESWTISHNNEKRGGE